MGEPPKPAQDVYSLSAMVYECLKGEPPFSHGQIEFQIKNKVPELLPGKGMLSASIMAGLSKAPASRPNECSAVLSCGADDGLMDVRHEARTQDNTVSNNSVSTATMVKAIGPVDETRKKRRHGGMLWWIMTRFFVIFVVGGSVVAVLGFGWLCVLLFHAVKAFIEKIF